MICVSVSHMDQLQPALESGAGLLELRFDLLRKDADKVYSQVPASARTIATCRPGWISESERAELLGRAIELGAAYVDLEIEHLSGSLTLLPGKAGNGGCEVIVSHHDFGGTPGKEELKAILEQCYKGGGEVAKIACQVNGRNDLLNLLSLFELPGRKVVLGMGSQGRISRVVAPYLGSEFTFASAQEGGETAPGQLSVKQLQDIYKSVGS